MKGKILVFIQFASLLAISVTTQWPNLKWWSYVLLTISILLAIWSIGVMRLGNFNIVPTPVSEGIFISSGPYRLIRHPMYLSIIIALLGILSSDFSYPNIIISMVLTADLFIKLHYEEKLLLSHFSNYSKYRLKTKKLIPLIW